ncbi:NAD-P-binding protein [Stereum hirsutum FP-91666 SS1]|uniref:NAD-P-binding protein n=1 Tax=Stereum hirsutum (strain FP-91666) TaxID=721885 RepID=UPI000444A4E7|nr:NAD-P-binding protein [Stereum hirsutum FP-91666 SS1]EIM82362.1 NAD-P-binding protein [Stereum hirsutum FP-91666 SS1]
MSTPPNTSNTTFILPTAGAGVQSITSITSPIPTPKAHEVLVRIHAVSLNFRDYAIASGRYPLTLKENLVPGSDMAGEVAAVGDGVEEWKVGERVTANFDQGHLYGASRKTGLALGGTLDGVLTQYRIFPSVGLLRVPKHLSYEEAACWPCAGVTAWNALFGAIRLLPGQTVLCQGTGGVSIMALMFASAAGAKTIITSSSDEKLELAKKLGATHTINYKTHPDWEKLVLDLTDGEGAHHIIDNVGINEIEKCLNCVASGGSIDCIGFLGGHSKETPNVPLLAIMRNAIVRGVYVGSKQQFEELLKFVETKGLRPHIDKVFKFENTVKAIEYLGAGQHTGKIVVKVVE